MMTEEQIEELRRQIAAYAIVSDHLLSLHNIISTEHQLAGMDMYDNAGLRVPTRKRWSPTETQLQILEHLFEKNNGNLDKQRMKEITAELSQHGEISESKVHNWFQNRKARLRRKNIAKNKSFGSELVPRKDINTTEASKSAEIQCQELKLHGSSSCSFRSSGDFAAYTLMPTPIASVPSSSAASALGTRSLEQETELFGGFFDDPLGEEGKAISHFDDAFWSA